MHSNLSKNYILITLLVIIILLTIYDNRRSKINNNKSNLDFPWRRINKENNNNDYDNDNYNYNYNNNNDDICEYCIDVNNISLPLLNEWKNIIPGMSYNNNLLKIPSSSEDKAIIFLYFILTTISGKNNIHDIIKNNLIEIELDIITNTPDKKSIYNNLTELINTNQYKKLNNKYVNDNSTSDVLKNFIYDKPVKLFENYLGLKKFKNVSNIVDVSNMVDVSKVDYGSKVSNMVDGSKVDYGSKVSNMVDGSKVDYGSKVSNMVDGSKVSNMVDGSKVSNMVDGSKVSNIVDGSKVSNIVDGSKVDIISRVSDISKPEVSNECKYSFKDDRNDYNCDALLAHNEYNTDNDINDTVYSLI